MPKNIDVVTDIKGKSSQRSLKRGCTVSDLLDELGLLPDAHIAVKDGKPIPMTQVLKDGDRIRIIKVASGG